MGLSHTVHQSGYGIFDQLLSFIVGEVSFVELKGKFEDI